VVGNPAEFDTAAVSLGPANKIDITIPAAPKGLLPEQPGSAR